MTAIQEERRDIVEGLFREEVSPELAAKLFLASLAGVLDTRLYSETPHPAREIVPQSKDLLSRDLLANDPPQSQ